MLLLCFRTTKQAVLKCKVMTIAVIFPVIKCYLVGRGSIPALWPWNDLESLLLQFLRSKQHSCLWFCTDSTDFATFFYCLNGWEKGGTITDYWISLGSAWLHHSGFSWEFTLKQPLVVSRIFCLGLLYAGYSDKDRRVSGGVLWNMPYSSGGTECYICGKLILYKLCTGFVLYTSLCVVHAW